MASSNENQGLQIAVIIFALLTIIMSGATFYVFKLSEDAELRAKSANESAAANKASLDGAVDELIRLKRIAGFKEDEKIDDIERQYTAHKSAYMQNFPEGSQSYLGALQYLTTTLRQRNTEVSQERVDLTAMGTKIDTQNTERTAREATYRKEAEDAKNEIIAQRDRHKQANDKIVKDNNDMKQALADARGQLAAALDKAAKEIQVAQAEATKLRGVNEQQGDLLTKLTTEEFNGSDGEVRWVSPQTKSVWINIGREDALRRQVAFGVYGVDDNGVARKAPKGRIEVTQILGDHLAEARIVEDTIDDPIVMGDQLYSPLYQPGRPQRFAFCGMFDVNGDKLNDVDMLRQMVQTSGGILDAEMMPDGKIEGQMSVETRFLVMGTPFSGQDTPYSEMQKEAKTLGIGIITVERFLEQMGWKEPEHAQRLGKAADPKDWQYRPINPLQRPPGANNPAGVNSFRQRPAPPRSNGGSAFGGANVPEPPAPGPAVPNAPAQP